MPISSTAGCTVPATTRTSSYTFPNNVARAAIQQSPWIPFCLTTRIMCGGHVVGVEVGACMVSRLTLGRALTLGREPIGPIAYPAPPIAHLDLIRGFGFPGRHEGRQT